MDVPELALRSATWAGPAVGQAEECSEGDPLLGDKQHAGGLCCGLALWLARLGRCYSFRFLLFLCFVQHITKGFVSEFSHVAQGFLYRSYHVDAAQMQMFGTLSGLPWTLKPVIGLLSEACPLAGFRKAPYSAMASTLGAAAFLVIGLVQQASLPILVLVVCTFFCTLHVVVSDVLTQGHFTEKVQATNSPQLRADLLTYVWLGLEVASLVSTLCAGPTIQFLGPKFVYLFAAAPAAALIYFAASGYFEEQMVSAEELAKVRQRFWEQRDVCVLALLILAGATSVTCSVIASGDPAMNCAVALVAGAVIIFGFSVVLTPSIASFTVFNVLCVASAWHVEGAEFYFLTDTPEQYPEGPHLSPFFVTTVLGVARIAFSMVGIFLYQRFSSTWTYRGWFFMSCLVVIPCRLAVVALYARLNLRLGIPDWVWATVAIGLTFMAEKLLNMPLLYSISYLSPIGMESTMFALLVGVHNFGYSISSNVGAELLRSMGVRPSGQLNESSQFQNLSRVSLIVCAVRVTVPLLLLWLVPNATQNERLISDGPEVATANSLWRRWRSKSAEPTRKSRAHAKSLSALN